jgi:hypothetical protein
MGSCCRRSAALRQILQLKGWRLPVLAMALETVAHLKANLVNEVWTDATYDLAVTQMKLKRPGKFPAYRSVLTRLY